MITSIIEHGLGIVGLVIGLTGLITYLLLTDRDWETQISIL